MPAYGIDIWKYWKVLEIKSTWILTLKYRASAADQLVSKIDGNSSASRQKFLLVMDVASKKKQKQFFGAHAIGNRQHVDEQNERSLGTNYPSWMKTKMVEKGGYPT